MSLVSETKKDANEVAQQDGERGKSASSLLATATSPCDETEADPKQEQRDREVAQQVLDHLEQEVAYGSSSTNDSEWHNHIVQHHIKSFSEKLESKRIERMLTGDTA